MSDLKIHIWAHPRTGSTYMYHTLKQAYEPTVGLDEPLWNTKTQSTDVINSNFVDVLKTVDNVDSIVSKHHCGHETVVRGTMTDDWNRYKDMYNYNIFLCRKNIINTCISNLMLNNKMDRKNNFKSYWSSDDGLFYVNIEQFIGVFNAYVGQLISVMLSPQVKFDEVVIYEELSTNPSEMLEILDVTTKYPVKNSNIELVNLYTPKDYKKIVGNYSEVASRQNNYLINYLPDLFCSHGHELNTTFIKEVLSR